MQREEFSVFDPQTFFDQFVSRAYKDHTENPTDRYHIKVAVHQANVLAERVWAAFHNISPEKVAGSKSASGYREYLAKSECSDFQLIWDLDDGHKHVDLRRRNRKVTSAAQTGFQQSGGAFDSAMFDGDAFDVGTSELIVRLDDGTERSVSELLTNVVEMWERLLKRL
jgi:hypothetical protein